MHAKALAFIDDVRHRAEREQAAAEWLRAQVVTVLVVELGVRYGGDIDPQPGAAENELPENPTRSARQRTLLLITLMLLSMSPPMKPRWSSAPYAWYSSFHWLKLAEHAEADRAFAQHPLMAHIDHAVANAPVPHRRSGVREFHLSRPVVFIVEIAAVDAPYARRRFEEQVIAEILAAEGSST